jgi:catecholate siderophore receptor
MKPTLRPSPLAAALFLSLSAPAWADLPADPSATELETVEVQGAKMEKAASPKYTEILLNTPQTITVINRDVMDQQNLIGLRDVLSTLPGITFGAGEGGGGYGDSINLRGFSANNDITTDGVRDSAQYTRTDNFNLESIELVNGSNSVFSGAGSVGGNINLVSKMAREGDFSNVTLGAGTDGYGRITADSNFDFETGTAVRLNAMVHQNDAPGRDYEQFERWGFASSAAFGLGSDTRFTLNFLHQQDENTPQYGVPYYRNAYNDGPLPTVDPSNYYGYHNVDTQEIDVNMLTGIFEHDFSDTVTLRSLARFQKVDQLSIVNAVQGTWCLAGNVTPTNASCVVGTGAAAITVPAGQYLPSGPRGYVRDTSNAIGMSQTDLTARFNTGSVEHALVAGVSFSRETFDLDVGSVFRNADGSNPFVAPNHLPFMDIANPDSYYTGPYNYTLTGRTEGTLSNQAVYVFDTLKFSEKLWLNLGARYERNEGDTATWNVSTTAGPAGPIGTITGKNPAFVNEDNLFSYRAGLIFKPAANGSIYLSFANSKTPSKASVNGACTAATCNVDPETAVNIELGTKWELLDNRLALNAALFRNEREDYKVADPGNPLNPSGEQQLDGKARVQGIALGAAGNITREWSVFANYTYLDSEVINGISENCYNNPSTACGNSITMRDPLQGNPLVATPKHSGSVWTTYRLDAWTFGYGTTYQGEIYLNNNSLPAAGSTTPATLYTSPDYWVHRAMVGYQVNDRIGLQLNINNLLDKEYYTRIRNNGWATPGDARSAVLTATLRF